MIVSQPFDPPEQLALAYGRQIARIIAACLQSTVVFTIQGGMIRLGFVAENQFRNIGVNLNTVLRKSSAGRFSGMDSGTISPLSCGLR